MRYLLRAGRTLLSIVAGCACLSHAVRAATITQWTFDDNTTTPAVGTGSAAGIGGISSAFAGGNPGSGRGWNTATYPAQGTNSRTAGVLFTMSTAGHTGIVFTFDQRHSSTSSNTVVVQYSTDGTSWTDGSTFTAPAGDTWYPARTLDLTGVPAADNNPNFAVRILSAFADGAAYVASNPTSTYATSGTWRFDNVTLTGTPAGAQPPVITAVAYSPSAVAAGEPYTVSANITQGTNPIAQVTADLSALGGSSTQVLTPDAANAYSYSGTVDTAVSPGFKTISVSAADNTTPANVAVFSTSIAVVDPNPPSPNVAISQVYGGGETPEAWRNDFVELYNRGNTDVDLSDYSIQYASDTGTSWTRADLSGTIKARGYFLIWMNAHDASTAPALPPADALATGLNPSATGGKLVLLSTKVFTIGPYARPSLDPAVANNVVDFVGYGAAAYEGSAPAPGPDGQGFQGIVRLGTPGGSTDTNDNAADFTVSSTLTPRNSRVSGHSAGAPVKSSPTAFGGNVFFGNSAGIVRSVNAATGTVNWSYNVNASGAGGSGSSQVLGRPAYRLVGGSSYLFVTTNDANVICLNADTGARVWNAGPLLAGATGVQSTPAVTSMASLADGDVYVTADGPGGAYVYRLSGVNGAVEAASVNLGAGISSPSVNEAGVFVGVTGGAAAAYRLTLADLTATNEVGVARASSAPPFIHMQSESVYPRVLVGAGDGTLSAFNASNGTPEFTDVDITPAGAPTLGVLMASRDSETVYVPGNDGKVYAASVADGAAPAGGHLAYDSGEEDITGLVIDPAGLGSPAGPTLVFGDSSGNIHQVLLRDPAQKSVVRVTTSPLATTPGIDAVTGRVFLGADDGALYAVTRQ